MAISVASQLQAQNVTQTIDFRFQLSFEKSIESYFRRVNAYFQTEWRLKIQYCF